jgi:hypothetical protein
MWLDAAILLLIVFVAWRGANAGAGVAAVQLVGLPLAYAGALGAAHVFGPALAREFEWPGLLAALVAGTGGLFLVQALLSLSVRALRDREHTPAAGSQAAGALFGALRGALFALPLLWLGGLAEGARVAGLRPDLPDLSGAQLPAMASEVLGAGVEAVLDENAADSRLAVHIAARPAETIGALQRVMSDPRIVALQRDTGFWREVENGAVAAALRRPTARQLVGDPSFRGSLVTLGAVSPEARGDERRFEAELSAALAELGPRLRTLRRDPALEELLDDPLIRAVLERGNTLTLLSDPRFHALVSRATR